MKAGKSFHAEKPIRYRAVIAYDGYGYSGFQVQDNARSIQAEIEKALKKITKEDIIVTPSGRTDAGVHALGQVIHFDSRLGLEEHAWLNALNTILPRDIRFRSVTPTDERFHARFSAHRKVYRYVYTLDQGDPFAFRTKTLIFKKPDIEKMRQAAALLLGEHDFSGFTKKLLPGKSPVKTIDSIDIEERGKDIILTWKGDGFLRHQVRRMSAALLQIGYGKLSLPDFEEMIAARKTCPYKAEGSGLYLVEVCYGPE